MGLKLDFMICTQIIIGGRVHKNSLFKFAENFRDGQSWKLNIFDSEKKSKTLLWVWSNWKIQKLSQEGGWGGSGDKNISQISRKFKRWLSMTNKYVNI